MPAHRAAEDARERALVAGIHVLLALNEDVDGTGTRACPSPAMLSAASLVNPTCGDKPDHDGFSSAPFARRTPRRHEPLVVALGALRVSHGE